MDFTEVYADFMDAAKLPDEVETMTQIQQKIEGYYDLHGKGSRPCPQAVPLPLPPPCEQRGRPCPAARAHPNPQIGRAHVRTPVTIAHRVRRLLLEKNKQYDRPQQTRR